MADNTPQTGSATIAADDIGGGVLVQRVKPCFGADGTATDPSAATPFPVALRDTGKALIQLYATGVASGTTGTETAIALAKAGCTGAAPAAGANSITPSSGKRFRITSITFAARGHATATAQITTFTLRCNSAGAVTTTSNAALVAQ